jgi:hypothetical protein
MAGPEVFFSYTGPLDYQQIDLLLIQLRETGRFRDLQKITGKRVYSVVVECLENILKHAVTCNSCDNTNQPSLSVGEYNEMIVIRSGNLVTEKKVEKIKNCIKNLNSMNRNELAELYEKNISKELQDNANGNGAGLGCIIMRIKSDNDLMYSFRNANDNLIYFELRISINKYHEKAIN